MGTITGGSLMIYRRSHHGGELAQRLGAAAGRCACREPRPRHATRRSSLTRPPTRVCRQIGSPAARTTVVSLPSAWVLPPVGVRAENLVHVMRPGDLR